MKDQIAISGRDGAFRAYISRPEVLPAPVVIVLQELFGVNADIRYPPAAPAFGNQMGHLETAHPVKLADPRYVEWVRRVGES
jgi:Dienelactone hydrolase family